MAAVSQSGSSFRECSSQRNNACLLPFVNERAIRERLLRMHDGDLTRQDDTAKITQNRTDVNKTPQPTERTRRGAHE